MSNKKAFSIHGIIAFIITIIITTGSFYIFSEDVAAGIIIITSILFVLGLRIVGPNTAMVTLFLGKYAGTLTESGFVWTIPLLLWTKNISLKINSTESEKIKVNDKSGNPIMIGSIIAWKVQDPYKALFCVEKYEEFVRIQTDAAVRKIASEYNYDTMGSEAEITLSSGGESLNAALTKEIEERVAHAGIEIIEARIGHLSYASEIAQAMLKRQQASATIAARSKIVEGAVSMVDMALLRLSEQKVVDLSPDDKAKMAINLLTVLCSENVQPTIQTNPNS